MSKNFDEGGAKGLLLANLGVGTSGCKIVFDSTLDEEEKEEDEEEEDDATPADDVPQDIDAPDQTAPAPSSDKTAVDVTSLVAKLAALLISASGGNEDNSRNDANTSTYSTGGNNNSNKMTVGNIPLVPQLISLREQFHDLNTEGFVDDAVVAVRIWYRYIFPVPYFTIFYHASKYLLSIYSSFFVMPLLFYILQFFLYIDKKICMYGRRGSGSR